MSYEPQQQPPAIPEAQQPPATGWTPPKPKRGAVPWLIGALVVSLLAVAALAFILLAGDKAPALTQSGAEQACRTAFSKEWKSRAKDVTAVVSVQQIEMLETTKTAGGYVVNGTVHYTITMGLIDPVEDTVDLSCSVSGSDAAPTTAVSNRG